MLDKSTLSMVVVGIADAGESGKRGPAGADNAGGDIAVYPMLLGQLPRERCSRFCSFKTHIFCACPESLSYLLSLKEGDVIFVQVPSISVVLVPLEVSM